MKLHFQYNYKCEFKKSKEAFIIIQKYPLSCYVISDFWRTLTGNCDKQNIMFLCIKYMLILLLRDIFSTMHYKRNQKV